MRTLALLPLFFLAATRSDAQSLEGAWRVAEIRLTGANTKVTTNRQPGLILFTRKHYSIVRIEAFEPRKELPTDLTKATAAELLAAFDSVSASAGTYEVAGNKLTLNRVVAKNPGAMTLGAFEEFDFKIEGGVLTLTNVRDRRGPIVNPTTLKLTKAD